MLFRSDLFPSHPSISSPSSSSRVDSSSPPAHSGSAPSHRHLSKLRGCFFAEIFTRVIYISPAFASPRLLGLQSPLPPPPPRIKSPSPPRESHVPATPTAGLERIWVPQQKKPLRPPRLKTVSPMSKRLPSPYKSPLLNGTPQTCLDAFIRALQAESRQA